MRFWRRRRSGLIDDGPITRFRVWLWELNQKIKFFLPWTPRWTSRGGFERDDAEPADSLSVVRRGDQGSTETEGGESRDA